MRLLSTIKSLLGLGGDRDAGTPVGVEREPAAASERAVKGVEETGSPADDAPGAPATGDGEPVDAIKGVGPSYAERLASAGVHTVEDLAAADAEALAVETDIGSGRLENWIEQARARSD